MQLCRSTSRVLPLFHGPLFFYRRSRGAALLGTLHHFPGRWIIGGTSAALRALLHFCTAVQYRRFLQTSTCAQ